VVEIEVDMNGYMGKERRGLSFGVGMEFGFGFGTGMEIGAGAGTEFGVGMVKKIAVAIAGVSASKSHQETASAFVEKSVVQVHQAELQAPPHPKNPKLASSVRSCNSLPHVPLNLPPTPTPNLLALRVHTDYQAHTDAEVSVHTQYYHYQRRRSSDTLN